METRAKSATAIRNAKHIYLIRTPENATRIVENATPVPANESAINGTRALPSCPPTPPNRVGLLATYKEILSFEQLEKELKNVKNGGRFTPTECHTEQRVAVLVPYRNRLTQLRSLLHNLHSMLMKQQIDYGIFVIEQVGNITFNRGALLNIGFVESIKAYNYNCFIFHDVDLIPEDDRIYYGCGPNPRHLVAAMDKYNYRLPYQSYFGGVSQLPRSTIEKMNGCSNLYFGWGGEDDDIYQRVVRAGFKIERYSKTIARYRMIKHGRDKTNAVNPKRFSLLQNTSSRMQSDGLNSLKYKLLKIEHNKLFTNISVEVRKEDYGL
ncbi:beta-1,4-N-acetylgalactosaminyltransferase bre-4-like [Ylistrum balloti]|uniref:beta-1,4-N-acetylgalactosaminyltransferase bre-4-like n=1 Tax=Ylistrum balloti TaxID=509963 RepID=UPI002905A639|nr:beta-1,4-N-acetylgalactosaminyltransferase bre-4-like [Ylistrum balloti]